VRVVFVIVRGRFAPWALLRLPWDVPCWGRTYRKKAVEIMAALSAYIALPETRELDRLAQLLTEASRRCAVR
jgi:hypothetical protein